MTNKRVIVGVLVSLVGCGSSGGGGAGGRGGTGGLAGGGAGGAGATPVGGRSGGAGGGGGAAACGIFPAFGVGTSTGTMSWKDNGMLVCPLLVIADRTTSSLADTIE